MTLVAKKFGPHCFKNKNKNLNHMRDQFCWNNKQNFVTTLTHFDVCSLILSAANAKLTNRKKKTVKNNT
jgi:hypothetical protein